MSILLFILVLVVLIIVHELGHFLFAKWFGVRVDEFGVGYPPRAYTLFKRGDTTYTVNWLPFGGFVRIFGERRDIEYSSEEREVAFITQPKWKQVAILIAGVVFNIVFAWILFSGALWLGAPTAVSEAQVANGTTQLLVNSVLSNTPAAAVGLMAGDRIVAITSTSDALTTMTPSATITYIKEHAGKPIVITYVRNNQKPVTTAPLAPAQGVLTQSPGTPAIGVSLALVSTKSLGIIQSLQKGFTQTVDTLVNVTTGLGTFGVQLVEGKADLSQVAGPVGIAGMVGKAASVGIVYLMYFTAFISVNLAVINIIPIPALDGGRILFILIEGVIRRPIPEKVTTLFNLVGFAAIIILMIVVTYGDIAKIVTGGVS